MKRVLSIGLLLLLVYNMLGYAVVLVSVWWQEQHELSERVKVYPSTDHLVEFHVPLKQHPSEAALTRKQDQGFKYRGSYYEIIRAEISGDTLHITGYEDRNYSFWQDDLLSFIKREITGTSDTQKKTNQLLKLLLKEYFQPDNLVCPAHYAWNSTNTIPPYTPFRITASILPHSPPPKQVC
ncbi:hypothetical protein GCM10023189_29650 [Nibrella saemangeumensis]|uniref:Uncharacterized protein n=1 Tax=Nibrella saemangeumensis TaxID=1084526 RepID=A0ABP8N1D1_9BACT